MRIFVWARLIEQVVNSGALGILIQSSDGCVSLIQILIQKRN
jgi:hypothetical protein